MNGHYKKLLEGKGGKEAEKNFMKHMIFTFLLWLISKEKTHGYEIIKKMEADEGFRMLTASQLYPILKEMTAEGLVTQRKEMTGKRARKVYQITEKGRGVLKEIKRCILKKPLKRAFMLELAGG